jgi:thyrotropin-releasing hormone receptor
MGELDLLLPHHVAANLSSELGGLEANCSHDEAMTGVCNVTLEEDECVDAEYYAFSYSMVGTVLQSAIFVVGVVGNVLVCSVVRRMRSMHSTTNCYLVSLAVADTITLLASVPQEVLSYHILGDQWVWGSVGCTLMIYLQYLGIDASALSLTAFTVERYIAICHPMKSKSICTLSRAKKIIAGCWIFAILYCSPWFLLTTTRTLCVKDVGNITTCRFRLRRDSTEYLVMFFADMMIFYVIPLLLSVVLYSLIARMLLTSSRNKFHGSGVSNGAPTTLSVSEAAMKSNQSRVQVRARPARPIS